MIPTAMTLPEEDAPLWDILRDEDECERYILISVIRKSREDFNNEKSADEYWGNMADQVKERSAEEEEMLKSIQEHSQQGIDDAIMKNLENGLQSLLLHEPQKNSPVNDKASPTSPPTTSPKDVVDGKSAPIKPPRSASNNRPGTSKKQQQTIVATPEKPLLKKSEERRKSVSGTTVTVGAAPSKTSKKPNIAPLSPPASDAANSSKANSPANPISPTTKFDYRSLLKDREQVPEEKIAERAAYLRQQRDKLLELKRAEREKQLQEQSEKASVERPRTAMAARKALAGVGAAPSKTSKKPNIAPLSPPVSDAANSSKANSPANPISPTTKFDYRSLLKDREQVPEEKIAERAAYLRQQRDKLLELKRAEREKQLQEQSEKASVERPRTAMAARKALAGGDESKLESRRAIASKLKAQIVDIGNHEDDEKQPLI
uniref:Uncharacterized protein n=1 Tax=Panagrolaimus sp. ES5 TaxID=591445 RepID=A0AC34G1G4_9BILA